MSSPRVASVRAFQRMPSMGLKSAAQLITVAFSQKWTLEEYGRGLVELWKPLLSIGTEWTRWRRLDSIRLVSEYDLDNDQHDRTAPSIVACKRQLSRLQARIDPSGRQWQTVQLMKRRRGWKKEARY